MTYRFVSRSFCWRNWWWPGALAFALVALQAGGLAPVLRYDRIQVMQGEFWRLFTGNFVHFNWRHLLLNLTGLVLIQALFADRLNALRFLSIVVMAGTCVGLGLHYAGVEVQWYVGFSGILHGLFMAGAILLVGTTPREPVLAALLLAVVLAKLIGEQFGLAVSGSEQWTGVSTVVDAHLYGALGGAMLAGLFCVWKKQGPPVGGP